VADVDDRTHPVGLVDRLAVFLQAFDVEDHGLLDQAKGLFPGLCRGDAPTLPSRGSTKPEDGPSQQRLELPDGEPGLLEDVRQGGSLDRAMGGNGQFKSLRGRSFLKPDVTSPLTDDDPTVPFQRGDDSLIAKARDLIPTVLDIDLL
jgi:hypothetical protein